MDTDWLSRFVILDLPELFKNFKSQSKMISRVMMTNKKINLFHKPEKQSRNLLNNFPKTSQSKRKRKKVSWDQILKELKSKKKNKLGFLKHLRSKELNQFQAQWLN